MLVTVITISLASKASTWRACCTSPCLRASSASSVIASMVSVLANKSCTMVRTSTGARASVGSRATISSSFPVTSASVASARADSFSSRAASADLVSAKAETASSRTCLRLSAACESVSF